MSGNVYVKKDANGVPITLTKDEQEKLFSYLKKDSNSEKAGVLLCLFAGIHEKELVKLQWKHFCNDCIKFDRNIPLDRNCADILKTIKRGEPEQYFLTGKERPITLRTYLNRVVDYREETGIENLSFAIVRNTYAANTLRHGVSGRTVTNNMGYVASRALLKSFKLNINENGEGSLDDLPVFKPLSEFVVIPKKEKPEAVKKPVCRSSPVDKVAAAWLEKIRKETGINEFQMYKECVESNILPEIRNIPIKELSTEKVNLIISENRNSQTSVVWLFRQMLCFANTRYRAGFPIDEIIAFPRINS